MNDKKQELAKKKALLEEFKKRKIEREKQKLLGDHSFTSNSKLKQDATKISDMCSSNDVDQLLSSLGLENLVKSTKKEDKDVQNDSKIASTSENKEEFVFEIAIKTEKKELNRNAILNQVNIYPDEKIKYSKECQTIESVTDMLNETNLKNGTDEEENDSHNESSKSKKKQKLKPLAYYEEIFVYDTFQWEDEFEQEHPKSKTLNEQIDKSMIDNFEKNSFQVHSHNDKIFSDSDNYEDDDGLFSNSYKSRNHLFYHDKNEHDGADDYDNMVKFLLKNRPIVERALKQNEKNIFFDYKSENLNKKKNDSNEDAIRLKKSFSDKKWSSSIVTCLDWSYQHPELLLCSYDNMSFYSEQSDSEATVAIWNVKSDQKEPQQLFSSISLITSCIFSPFHPNIILAGTYSGQIIMWDLRSNRRTPIQRSAISTNCHTNPIYCLKNKSLVETESLISISNDGKMCMWHLENFNMPYETQELVLKDANIRNISATCFDTLDCFSKSVNGQELNETDLNTKSQPEPSIQLHQSLVVIGSEEGLVHTLSHKNNKFEHVKSYDEHYGPLTAISSQNQLLSENRLNIPHLFLTSSFDSTVKLWDMTEPNQRNPIFTFENRGEYVYDVGWSPKHPSLFASVDGSGKLDIWNINKDSENSVLTISVDNGTKSLNRLKWSRNGTEIAVGDDHGKISIYEINESIALPNQNEFDLLLNSLKTLKQLEKETKVFNKKEDFLINSF